MKELKKYAFFACALILTLVVGLYYTFGGYCFKKEEISANVRTVSVENADMDYQAILNEFEESTLVQEEALTTFMGYQTLDSSLFEEFDNISVEEIESYSGCKVSYSFTYDSDSNVVTLSAEMENEYGEIAVDTLSGVGFINESGEIDAVMNVDGEGILLSEMRSAGIIQNCGWFAKLFKKVVKTVAVVATVVAAAAVVVATAGVAATAVVGVGVAAATTASAVAATAATITGYATITAAIAAGIALTADMITEIEWQGLKYKMQELTDAVRYTILNNSYYLAIATSDGKMFITSLPVTEFVAMTAARGGLSVYTYYINNAVDLARIVNYNCYPKHHNAHGRGLGYFNHYHVYKSNQTSHIFYGAPIL